MPTKQIDALDNAQALGWADTQITRDEAGAVSVGTAKVVAVEDGGTLTPGLSAATVRTSLGLGAADSPTFTGIFSSSWGIPGGGVNGIVSWSDVNTLKFSSFGLEAIIGRDYTRNQSAVNVNELIVGPVSNISVNQSTQTVITSDAANTLAQRNGLNAQAFHIYNTYTDASNYERGVMKWDGNVLKIRAEAAGTGANRSLQLFSPEAITLSAGTGILVSNYIRPTTTAIYDLGISTRSFRDIYLHPSASLTPASNGDLCIEATNNTTLTFRYKGSDSVVRSGTVTLS